MAKWRCKKARSNFYSPITAYLLFLHAYNFGRIFTTKNMWICPDHSLLSALFWHLVSPPTTSSSITIDKTTRNCVLCLLSAIICIEVKFGHHVLFNLVGNPWFHSCAGRAAPLEGKCSAKQGYRPRPPTLHQTLTAATKNISNVSAHRLSVCAQSAAKKYHHIFLKKYSEQ